MYRERENQNKDILIDKIMNDNKKKINKDILISQQDQIKNK